MTEPAEAPASPDEALADLVSEYVARTDTSGAAYAAAVVAKREKALARWEQARLRISQQQDMAITAGVKRLLEGLAFQGEQSLAELAVIGSKQVDASVRLLIDQMPDAAVLRPEAFQREADTANVMPLIEEIRALVRARIPRPRDARAWSAGRAAPGPETLAQFGVPDVPGALALAERAAGALGIEIVAGLRVRRGELHFPNGRIVPLWT